MDGFSNVFYLIIAIWATCLFFLVYLGAIMGLLGDSQQWPFLHVLFSGAIVKLILTTQICHAEALFPDLLDYCRR